MRHFGAGFWSGFFIGVFCVIGCASSPIFPWHYYAPSLPSSCYDQGQLLGKLGSGGWPDLSMDECKPDPAPTPGQPQPSASPIQLKCMVMLVDDFYSLQADDEKCHSDLDSCQNPQPSGSKASLL